MADWHAVLSGHSASFGGAVSLGRGLGMGVHEWAGGFEERKPRAIRLFGVHAQVSVGITNSSLTSRAYTPRLPRGPRFVYPEICGMGLGVLQIT